ncbi:MAG: hypothetical protein Q8S39_04575 [Ignavibacteria bacterium]|nr:hypothetical protein [Ignavibacteria bacterium]
MKNLSFLTGLRNIRYFLLVSIMMVGFTIEAFGCEQHFPDGTIGNCPDQSCEDFIDPGDGTYCVECLSGYYNPNTTYISYDRKLGEAWIKTGGKPVRIMSDKYFAFSKALFLKYGKLKRDKAVNEKIKMEYAAFFKTDDHKVFPKRLDQCCKILGLKVRKG